MNIGKVTQGIFLGCTLSLGVVYADTLYVDKSGQGDFTTISEAINNAKDNDTIIVKAGKYRESIDIKNVNNLTIKAENLAFINNVEKREAHKNALLELRDTDNSGTLEEGEINSILNDQEIKNVNYAVITDQLRVWSSASGTTIQGFVFDLYEDASCSDMAVKIDTGTHNVTIQNNAVTNVYNGGIGVSSDGQHVANENIKIRENYLTMIPMPIHIIGKNGQVEYNVVDKPTEGVRLKAKVCNPSRHHDADAMKYHGEGHIIRYNSFTRLSYYKDNSLYQPQGSEKRSDLYKFSHTDCFQTHSLWFDGSNQYTNNTQNKNINSNIEIYGNFCEAFSVINYNNGDSAGAGYIEHMEALSIHNNFFYGLGFGGHGNIKNLNIYNNIFTMKAQELRDTAIPGFNPESNVEPFLAFSSLEHPTTFNIYDNIFYDSHHAPIYLYAPSSTGVANVQNNISYWRDGLNGQTGTTSKRFWFNCKQNQSTLSNAIPVSIEDSHNNKCADPMFNDIDQFDFSIESNSEASNHGIVDPKAYNIVLQYAHDRLNNTNDDDPKPEVDKYKLDIKIVGQGTINGSGLSCQSNCFEEFNENTEVTLTAIAQQGFTFDSWSGEASDCKDNTQCTIMMNNHKEIEALFSENPVIEPPKSSFEVLIDGLKISLLDRTTGENIVERVWSFGDGESSTATNPQHSYLNAGEYTVSLKVTNKDGREDSSSRKIVVKDSNPDVEPTDDIIIDNSDKGKFKANGKFGKYDPSSTGDKRYPSIQDLEIKSNAVLSKSKKGAKAIWKTKGVAGLYNVCVYIPDSEYLNLGQATYVIKHKQGKKVIKDFNQEENTNKWVLLAEDLELNTKSRVTLKRVSGQVMADAIKLTENSCNE